jgi:MauM/NapG family ferredoxin protein
MLNRDGSRRDLFRSAVDGWLRRVMERTEERVVARRYHRPPGALPEVAFLAACTRCGACVEACPPAALVPVAPDGGLAAGTPRLEPAMQPCAVCADMPCVRACPTDALTLPAAGWTGERLGEIELVPERCITFQGITCDACAQACPVGEAALAIDEAGHPVLRREACVGCGACVRACVSTPSSFDLRPLER